MTEEEKKKLFDDWPEAYDRWFTTPIGALVKKYEGELIQDLLRPAQGEVILDAGCGTGGFTSDMVSSGSDVIGLDISLPMIRRARQKIRGRHFQVVAGDLLRLPFPENSFDKAVSVTTLEFIEDAAGAFQELFRVTRKGGCVVAATLNSHSPWAARRRAKSKMKDTLFSRAIFRSPEELRSLIPVEGLIRTAIHFQKEDDPDRASEIEMEGHRKGLETGAFVAGRWEKI